MNWESKYSLLKLRNKEAKNSSGNECAEIDNQMTLMLNLRTAFTQPLLSDQQRRIKYRQEY